MKGKTSRIKIHSEMIYYIYRTGRGPSYRVFLFFFLFNICALFWTIAIEWILQILVLQDSGKKPCHLSPASSSISPRPSTIQHLFNYELLWEVPGSKLTSQPVVFNPLFVSPIYVEMNTHTHTHTHTYTLLSFFKKIFIHCLQIFPPVFLFKVTLFKCMAVYFCNCFLWLYIEPGVTFRMHKDLLGVVWKL